MCFCVVDARSHGGWSKVFTSKLGQTCTGQCRMAAAQTLGTEI